MPAVGAAAHASPDAQFQCAVCTSRGALAGTDLAVLWTCRHTDHHRFFASELFVPRLASFYRSQPTVHIRIDSPDGGVPTHPSTCDASILLVGEPPAGLYARQLFSLRLCAVCSQELAQSARAHGQELFRHVALIVHRARPDAWRRWAQENGHDTPDPDHVIELDSLFAVARAAERGLGIALLPTTLCDAWLRSGALMRLDERELLTAESFFLVVRPEDAERPEIRALTHWALRELGHVGASRDMRSVPVAQQRVQARLCFHRAD